MGEPTCVNMLRPRSTLLILVGLSAVALCASAECLCDSSLIVSDCCCDFNSVSGLTRHHLRPLLSELTETPFFRFFRVVLCETCAFPELGAHQLCGSPECPVCTCTRDALPCDDSGRCFLEPKAPMSVAPPDCPFGGLQGRGGVPPIAVINSEEPLNPWTKEPLEVAEYVDLSQNPERWTGYAEPQGSHQIWAAIHEDNCFHGNASKPCRNERVFTINQ